MHQFDTKKENLRRAFEELHDHSRSFSSFPLNWVDIDSYLSKIHSSLQSRLSVLHNNEQSRSSLSQNPDRPVPQSSHKRLIDENPRQFCQKMETLKLRDWLKVRRKVSMKMMAVELREALNFAPDPGTLVLDVIDGFRVKDLGLGDVDTGNRNCVLLLQVLMEMEGVRIVREVKERAKGLGMEWRGELMQKKDEILPLEAMAFLELLAGFRIGEEFDKDELLGFVMVVFDHQIGKWRLKQTCKLCCALGLEDKAPELVRRLAHQNKQLQAVEFVHEMKITDKCPPVPLLKAYLNEAHKNKKRVKRIGKRLEGSGATTSKSAHLTVGNELDALKTVHKYIKKYNLESEYPIHGIEKRIRIVEEQRTKTKAIRDVKPRQQKEWRPPKHRAEKASRIPPPHQQPHLHEAGSSLEQPMVSFSSPAAGPYSFDLPVPASSNGPWMGPYGLSGSGMMPVSGYAGNPCYPQTQIEGLGPGSHLAADSYGRLTHLAGFGDQRWQLPPFRPLP
ncbi:hypothetical protein Dimus_019202 [Dionaea muscipula]